MEIISAIYSNDELNNLISYADGFILMLKPFSVCYKEDINLDLALDLIKKNNKKAILGINKIHHPSDILEIKEFLKKYNSDVYYYVSDLGVCNILIEMGLSNKIIYNPETMITNYLDLGLLNECHFDAYQLSSEITLNDIKYAYEKTNAPLIYYGFGHKIMFYSKRKLLSLYENKTGIKMPKEGYLKEVTREDYMPVSENSNGTYILRSYVISLLDELDNLDYLKYLYLDSNFVEFGKYIEVLKLFNELNKKEINKEEALLKLNELKLNIQEGFKNNDTVYLKEELKK
ncbi:MAG: U32 family peptidase [Acholeplasmatales bacterium]|nr:U32 family peptidase [Acholeplasmatales bacterium]